MRGYPSREKSWVQLEASSGLGRAWVEAEGAAVTTVTAVGDEWAAAPSELGFYCFPQL